MEQPRCQWVLCSDRSHMPKWAANVPWQVCLRTYLCKPCVNRTDKNLSTKLLHDMLVEETLVLNVHIHMLPGRSAWIFRTTYCTAALAACPATPLLRCVLAACVCASPAWHHAPLMGAAAWMLNPAHQASLQCRQCRSQMSTPRMSLALTRQTRLPT